ncbi:FAD-dependent oxidoreductase [Pararhodonellum marinum]|uniref:FAD-dependent oxidoreductase n=1 Tax=Pararhodonellum marinum TaxID=2755358 RepID=UPI00188E72DE|nr:FAD-dependent oxidoreductase [Pararhodonellum marinum]
MSELDKKSLPIVFSIDDDPQVLSAIKRDLRKKYSQTYRILSTPSANEALESLTSLKNKGEQIALFLSDNRMPEMEGVDFLEKAKKIFPNAKRVLLTAYSDTQAAIKAINDLQLDYYLLKPWDPPEERLYPVLDDLLDDWQGNYIPSFKGLKLLGLQFSSKTHQIKDYLSSNLFPYQWLDYQLSAEAKEIKEANQILEREFPALIFEDGTVLKQPSLQEIALKLGLNANASLPFYDVTIVGAGPSGLAAAVYAASEGLKTLLIEKKAAGGQAGTSSRIENYLGFPNGLSGSDLARRAITQATRFGTEFLSPQEVQQIEFLSPYKRIHLKGGEVIHSKSMVITTGVNYRMLETKGLEELNGAGVYYGAANTEASFCTGKDVFIIGGGNSAGQAAIYLSKYATKVVILIRKDSLQESMSSYLIDQIAETPQIEVWGNTALEEALGVGSLETIKIKNLLTDEVSEHKAAALFIFIGAQAVSHWLPEEILKNDKGFIVTGNELLQHQDFKKRWNLSRSPYLLETSVPGVFSAGDVRAGAMNRVASAVGEGAMTISFVHKYLAEI